MDLQILFAIGFPLVMAAGGIAAWRLTKKQAEQQEQTGWRDDSLDDWRKERDTNAAARRESRAAEGTHLSTGSEEQQEVKKHQQRLGG